MEACDDPQIRDLGGGAGALVALLNIGCQGSDDPVSVSTSAVAVDREGEDDCERFDDESSDDGVDCGAIRRDVRRERGDIADEQARVAYQSFRRELRHRHVPLRALVAFYGPSAGFGRPTDPGEIRNLDQFVTMALCDPLTREVVTRHYIADHPEYIIGHGGER